MTDESSTGRLSRRVTEEQPAAGGRAKNPAKTIGVLVAVFALICLTVVVVVFNILNKKSDQARLSPDIQAQTEKMGRDEARRSQKEAQVQDRPYSSQQPISQQLEQIYKQMDQSAQSRPDGPDSASAPQVSLLDKMLAQGEHPASVQSPDASPSSLASPPPPPVEYHPGQGRSRSIYQVSGESAGVQKNSYEIQKDEYEKDTKPMFVYSKGFKGASYCDDPKDDSVAPSRSGVRRLNAEPTPEDAPIASDIPPASAAPTRRSSDEKSGPASLVWNSNIPITLFEGEFLDAVLTHRMVCDVEESPVVVSISKDLIDNSGKWVLIPTGTRVVGKSKVVNYMGANRLFVQFHRLIFPNGVHVDLPYNAKALKALDDQGAHGIVSQVNRHWMLQFGTAIFVGVLEGLGAAAQQHTDPYSGKAYVIEDTTDNFEKILNTIMQRYTNIVPTISVNQGKKVRLFMTDDLLLSPYDRVRNRSYAR